jgi:NADPH:quinone reductase-like Zn-dependent oxidoreductase
MKAAYISSLGGPDKLVVGELPRPKRSKGEVLIRVRAVGLNWLDVLLRTEDFGLSFPHIPGSDIVGTVEECDRDEMIAQGRAVIVNPAIPCGNCPGEEENPNSCRFVRIVGVHRPGGYGSLVTVPRTQVYLIPNGLSVSAAAAFPLDYLTAWRMLTTKADLRKGETVFIWGASGSLGTAAVKIAKSLGAVVLAAAGSTALAQELSKIGADHVVNYKNENVADWTKQMTGSAGVDCVFESVGAATFRTSMNMVRPHGRIVICGTRSGAEAQISLEDLYYNQIRILGSRMGNQSEFEAVLQHVGAPEWEPVISATYKIDSIRDAHRELERRHHIGKIVVLHE